MKKNKIILAFISLIVSMIYSGASAYQPSTWTSATNKTLAEYSGNYYDIYVSPNGLYYYVADDSDYIREFTGTVPYDISTISAYQTQSLYVGGQDNSVRGVEFSSDGKNIYISGVTTGNVYRYVLSTARDLTTATYTESKNNFTAGLSNGSSLSISDNGGILYVIYQNSNIDTRMAKWTLTTPYTLSGATVTTKIFTPATSPRGLAIDPSNNGVSWNNNAGSVGMKCMTTPSDISTLIDCGSGIGTSGQFGLAYSNGAGERGKYAFMVGLTNETIRRYTTNYADYPQGITPLVITGEAIKTTFEGGMSFTGLTANTDHHVDYIIEEWDGHANYEVSSGTLGNFAGGANTYTFASSGSFVFQQGKQYDISMMMYSLSATGTIVNKVLQADYNYSVGYIPPEEYAYDFFVSGYTFLPNGFILNNFVPSPSGGALYFELLQPSGTGTTEVIVGPYYPYDVDGTGYGFDSKVKITYPYHPVPGIYQVRIKYIYNGYTVYPFGVEYNSYTITMPEVRADPAQQIYSECDTDADGQTSIGEALTCTSTNIGIFFGKIGEATSALGGLFQAISKIGDTGTGQSDLFGWLVPTTHASSLTDSMKNIDSEEGGFLPRLVRFFLWTGILVLLIASLLLLKK